MAIHAFHLARTGPITSAEALIQPPTSASAPGLDRAECGTTMRLVASVRSLGGLQVNRRAMFAVLNDDASRDRFLAVATP